MRKTRRSHLMVITTVAMGVIVAMGTVALSPAQAAGHGDQQGGQNGQGQHGDQGSAHQAFKRYVVAPTSREVAPVRVLSTSGDVVHPDALLHGGITKLIRPAPAPKPQWPGGTGATASSYHDPNQGNDGRPRTYVPTNAIDGNPDTFWNDANPDTYPAVLTITAPAPVSLPGITVLSNPDGVPQDFTVETWMASRGNSRRP